MQTSRVPSRKAGFGRPVLVLLGVSSILSAFPWLGIPPAGGEFGGWIDFQQVQHRVRADNLTNLSSTAITVEFRVRAPAATSSMALFSYAVPSQENEILLYTATNLRAIIDGVVTGPSGINVTDGNWHHVAFSWDSATGNIRWYHDGVTAASLSAPVGLTLQGGGTLVLAEDQDSVGGGYSAGQALIGQMDEVRVWSVVRSAAQIQSELGLPLSGCEAGLALCWPMETLEDLGAGAPGSNDVRDLSPGGNHGDAENGTPTQGQPAPSPTYPGSGPCFELRSGIDSEVPNAVDVKPVQRNATSVTLEFTNDNGLFTNDPLFIVVQAFPTGAFPGPTPGLPDVQINLLQPLFILAGAPGAPLGQPTLPAAGYTVALPLPPGLTGVSILVQGAVASAASPQGYATGNAHEFAYPQRFYVSPMGSAANPGTASAPKRTISDAYALASAVPSAEVMVAAGMYNETPVFDHTVSVIGGLHPVTWLPTGTRSTVFVSNHGVRVRDIQSSAVISGFEFQAASGVAPPPGGPFTMDMASVAADVRDCGFGLRFEDCLFQAGHGANGVAGASAVTTGISGSPGSPGSNGFLHGPFNLNGSGGLGGSGGGGSTFGGAGADGGGVYYTAFTFSTVYEAVNGGNGASGSGGCGPGGVGSLGVYSQVAAVGTDAPETPGPQHGFEGTPAGSPGGIVNPLGDWRPAAASSGNDGLNGCGGGGGGGGGAMGGSTPGFYPIGVNLAGAGGGGGGGGGYRGQGGQGGIEGGASFAVYLFEASPTFFNCTFVAGQGGVGGSGGNGSAGGVGGSGGPGGIGWAATVTLGVGISYGPVSGQGSISFNVASGSGGQGAQGQEGGAGGGGGGAHGGPSYGVFRAGTSTPLGLNSPGITWITSQGGSGGLGGFSQGFAGTGGQTGPSGMVY